MEDDGQTEKWGSRGPAFSLGALLLILAPCLAYLPLLKAGFIWDDDHYVTENQTLPSVEGLGRIWFEPLSIPQYYPLVHTTYWMEYRLWGLHPTGYHVVNVLLHGLSSVLLWRLLARLQVPGAWLASAVFAVHPVMVESVAWITERKNVLSLPLALASLHFLLRLEGLLLVPQASKRPYLLYWISLLLFVAALLSKTVVCTLPAVVMVIAWWKSGKIDRGLALRLVPFFLVGIGLGLVTVWLEKVHVGASGAEWSMSALERVLLAGRNLWFYFGKILWPQPLMFFYPRWNVDSSQAWQIIFPFGFGTVLAFLWWFRMRIGRGPLAAVLIFSGVLFPALGFFDVYPFRYSFVADHFQYHASIALIALMAATVYRLSERLGSGFQPIGRVVATLVLVVLSVLTFRQSRAYESFESIFVDNLAKNPAAWGASSNLVKLYLSTNRTDEALELARQSVEVTPRIADTHNALGGALVSAATRQELQPQQLEEAVACFLETIRIEPKYHEAYFNLASTLVILGRHEEAADYFQELLRLTPNDLEAVIGLGGALARSGKADEATACFLNALQIQPDNVIALHGLGFAKSQTGQWDEAIRLYTLALQQAPHLIDVRSDLASALMAKKEFSAARSQYDHIVNNQPWNARARNNLGVALMNLGEKHLAIQQFQQACQLAPEYSEARENLERAQQTSVSP